MTTIFLNWKFTHFIHATCFFSPCFEMPQWLKFSPKLYLCFDFVNLLVWIIFRIFFLHHWSFIIVLFFFPRVVKAGVVGGFGCGYVEPQRTWIFYHLKDVWTTGCLYTAEFMIQDEADLIRCKLQIMKFLFASSYSTACISSLYFSLFVRDFIRKTKLIVKCDL